jgi:hypothetical protein
VKVRIEIECTTEALDEGHGSREASADTERTAALSLPGEDGAQEDAKRSRGRSSLPTEIG